VAGEPESQDRSTELSGPEQATDTPARLATDADGANRDMPLRRWVWTGRERAWDGVQIMRWTYKGNHDAHELGNPVLRIGAQQHLVGQRLADGEVAQPQQLDVLVVRLVALGETEFVRSEPCPG